MARAFTMVELVVTIGIIVLLVSMVVYAAGALVRRSEVTRTRNTLDMLEQARQAWELEAGRAITFGPTDATSSPPEYFDIDEGTMSGAAVPPAPLPGVFTQVDDVTRKMLAIFERSQEVKGMIARIEPDRVKRITVPPPPPPTPVGWLEIRDSWDTPIVAIHPGREWVAGFPPPPDEDGSWRTPFENVYGIPTRNMTLFVSAGPDGKFGHLHLNVAQGSLTGPQKADIALAADNLYSYEPKKDRP